MYPQSDEVIWLLDSILLGLKQTLEHIGQVTYVELIMEVLSSLSELQLDISEQWEGALHDGVNQFRNGYFETLEMLLQVSQINGWERWLLWHAYS